MMFSLLKKDYYVQNWVSYSSLAIGLIALYIVNIPPIFLFSTFFLSLLITLFYYDDKNKTNRYFGSLPVSKKKMVLGRYIFLAGLAMVLLLFQWMVTLYIPQVLPISRYTFDWRDTIVLYAIALVMVAVGSMILYSFRSFLLSTSILLVLYFISTFMLFAPLLKVLGMTDYIYFNEMDHGFVLLVEKYISFQPYLVLIAAAFLVYYIFLKVTQWIVSKRNL